MNGENVVTNKVHPFYRQHKLRSYLAARGAWWDNWSEILQIFGVEYVWNSNYKYHRWEYHPVELIFMWKLYYTTIITNVENSYLL